MAENAKANTTPAKSAHKGCVEVLTGDGKGKTTSALGTVLRSLGHGFKACIVVFMKGDYPYGEWQSLPKLPNVKIATFGFREFTNPAKIKPKEIDQAEKALAFAREAVTSGDYDIVVLDEINVAVAWKLIKLDDVIKLIQDKPPHVELILTGRYADPELIKRADLVTECLKVKHPYDEGLLSREGIEY